MDEGSQEGIDQNIILSTLSHNYYIEQNTLKQ